MVTFRNSFSSSKRFLVIEDKYRQTSLRVHEPVDVLFAKKWPFESIKHLSFLSLETSCELYGHRSSHQEVLQLQSFDILYG